MNILVLCTGNSARSILLEAVLNHLGQPGLKAFSAGSNPTGKVHPQALALLAHEGIDPGPASSKSWDLFGRPGAPEMSAVITVCSAAAGEVCPIWPGAPVRAHWGVPDPAAAPAEVQPEAFRAAYAVLRRRAEHFLAANPKKLGPAQLTTALRDAGEIA